MFCPKCGKQIPAGSGFCPKCGAKIGAAPTPTKTASVKVVGGAGVKKAKEILVLIKNFILNLSLGEKVIGAAAIIGFISFFLPWMRSTTVTLKGGTMTSYVSGLDVDDVTGWIWIQPIMMLVSLGLIYLAQRMRAVMKMKIASIQIIIGSIWTGIGFLGMMVAGAISKYFKGLAALGASPTFSLGVGWWFITLASIAIVVGAFLIQDKLLKGSK